MAWKKSDSYAKVAKETLEAGTKGLVLGVPLAVLGITSAPAVACFAMAFYLGGVMVDEWSND